MNDALLMTEFQHTTQLQHYPLNPLNAQVVYFIWLPQFFIQRVVPKKTIHVLFCIVPQVVLVIL
jgi:hypothetical protein